MFLIRGSNTHMNTQFFDRKESREHGFPHRGWLLQQCTACTTLVAGWGRGGFREAFEGAQRARAVRNLPVPVRFPVRGARLRARFRTSRTSRLWRRGGFEAALAGADGSGLRRPRTNVRRRRRKTRGVKLLAEQPSYGYQLIKSMEQRLSGGYTPSAVSSIPP